MAVSPAFTWVCLELERATPLSELEVRGTVRLALRQAGLDAQTVSGAEMSAVLRRILPKELANRAVPDTAPLCEALASRIEIRSFEGGDAVADVFRRLGGGG
jgi:hypothetical protein